MTIIQGRRNFLVAAQARLLGEGDKLQAWAERHVRLDPELKWILGNYVEADRANSNGHIFPLEYLAEASDTLSMKALNMLHIEQHCVGAFAGAQLVDADGAELSAEAVTAILEARSATDKGPAAQELAGFHPVMEALSAMWPVRFPDEYRAVRKAHAEGKLFYSMECEPVDVECPDCGTRTPFAGLEADTYCDHMQGAVGPKILHQPRFDGGAIVIPPAKPGWSSAEVKQVAEMLQAYDDELQATVYEEVRTMAPHLEPRDWEQLMAQLLTMQHDPESTNVVSLDSYRAAVLSRARQHGKALARDFNARG